MMTGINRNQTGVPSLAYSNNKLFDVDSILMLLVALAPILQHYELAFFNPSLAITSVIAVIALIRLGMHKIKVNNGFLLLIIYGLYASIIHGITIVNVMREMAQIIVFLAVINNLFNIKKLKSYYRIIAIFATILIIVQYFCFYILDFHIQLVDISLLNPKNSQWFDLVRTGMIGVTGSLLSFYRPSAFFLEPSHFAIYCIPVIVTTLFSKTGDKRSERLIAFFVSIGVFLSTSGMGIGMIIMCWAVYLAFFFGQKGKIHTIQLKKIFNKRSIVLIMLFLLILAILYITVPIFQKSVARIFFSERAAGLSAIEGRTATGLRSLGMLQGIRTLIGFGDIYDIADWNMSTFFFVTFKFGVIGMVLYYSFYIYSFFKLKREAQFMTGAFLILSLFTVHMFGAYYKMYYTILILFGYVQYKQEKDRLELLNTGQYR